MCEELSKNQSAFSNIKSKKNTFLSQVDSWVFFCFNEVDTCINVLKHEGRKRCIFLKKKTTQSML